MTDVYTNGVLKAKLDHIDNSVTEVKSDMAKIATAIERLSASLDRSNSVHATANEIFQTCVTNAINNLASVIEPIRDSISLKALRWMMFMIVAVVGSIKTLEYFLKV